MSKVIFENERISFLRIGYPRTAFASLIEYYFEVDSSGTGVPVQITGLPSVNTLIAIHYKIPCGRIEEQKRKYTIHLPAVQLLGHTTQSFNGIYLPGTRTFYAKLKPGVFTMVFPFTSHEIQNSQVDIQSLFRKFSLDKLQELPSFEARMNYIEEQFKLYLAMPFSYQQQIVTQFTRAFNDARFIASGNIEKLCKMNNVTYASVRRYFLQQTGVSPKYCQKIIRFKAALRAYRSNGYRFNSDDFGYTDFSHFCKDARHLTGKTPADL